MDINLNVTVKAGENTASRRQFSARAGGHRGRLDKAPRGIVTTAAPAIHWRFRFLGPLYIPRQWQHRAFTPSNLQKQTR